MHPLQIAGLPVVYFAAGEEIPPEDTAEVFRYRFRHEAPAIDHPRMRRVLIPKGTNGLHSTLLGVLHWDDDSDLAALDARLEEGASGNGGDLEDPLLGALLCEVASVTCSQCASAMTLVRPLEDYPAGKASGRRHRPPISVCPNCADTAFPRFVEVLET